VNGGLAILSSAESDEKMRQFPMVGTYRWSTGLFVAAIAVCFALATAVADTDSSINDELEKKKIWPNECAGHMIKSRVCGANSKKYALECCPGLVCDGRFCVESSEGEEEEVPAVEKVVIVQVDDKNNDQPTELLETNATQANYTAVLLELEQMREDLERERKEEERRRKEEERRRKEQEQLRQEEEARQRREEKQRQEEAQARRPEEKKALIRLYSETNGHAWNRNGGWLNDQIDHCKWEGIVCNDYGLVLNITLARNNMTGTIPNMSELQHMEVIDLHANLLEAELPIRVDYPSLRHVNLANNKLQGTLSSVSDKLEHLDLSSNTISGRFEPWFDLTVLCPTESPSSEPSSTPSNEPSSLPTLMPSVSLSPSPQPSSNNLTDSYSTNTTTITAANMTEEAYTAPSSNATVADNATLISNATEYDVPAHVPSPPCGPSLQYLSLADNEFQFVNVSQLTSLQHLDLSKNKAMEQSLADLGIDKLMFLESLNIGKSHKLNGDLRIGHMQYLKHLDLNGMKLEGEISLTGILNIATLSEINLSGGNDFSGEFFFCNMTRLEKLKLGRNRLAGDLSSCNLASLIICDLSDNEYTGSLSFSGSESELQHLNLHRNAFTGTLPTFEGLNELLYLHLGENLLTGALPELSMPSLRHLNISFNELTGELPSSISKLTVCDTIDLSHQARSDYFPSTGQRITRGLSGRIPSEVGQLGFLQRLILSNNLLSSTLPDTMAQLTYLELIDLEDNLLSGSIPSSINILEQLGSVLLARNRLTGDIPNLGGSKDVVRTVTMAGNPELQSPAPFTLCDLDDLDLRIDPKFCPSDRSALAAFYQSTKGSEWLVNTNWVSSFHHCEWYGVTCSPDRERTLKLELLANGLAGQLPDEFFEIETLTHLDLTDNDIRGAVPPLIAKFRDLQYLRLSYNRLTGIPDEISSLEKLSFVHLHSNRLEGNAKVIHLAERPEGIDLPEYRFISDCGDPQDVSDPFICEECDMCCNSLEECQVPHRRQFTALEATGILVAGAFAAICVAWLIVRYLVLNKILRESESFAAKAAGAESVYSFFLSNQRRGWLIACGTITIQVLVFSLFLSAASFDNDDGDFVYSWRCPLNTPECNDERAVGTYGWVMWAFLVTAALLDDFVNGIKLIFLSASRGSTPAFVSGAALVGLTALSVYSSLFYNVAIAMTNTELIVNAVILLFVNDVDEQVFGIVGIMNSKWLNAITDEAEEYSAAVLDQHLREQRSQSAIDAFRRARRFAARSLSGRTLSPRDRRRLWRGTMENVDGDIIVRVGSGDIFSVGSRDGSVLSGSPTKVGLGDGDLLRLVTSLQKRVHMLERATGVEAQSGAAAMYDVVTESVEPSIAASSSGDDSLEIPHVSL